MVTPFDTVMARFFLSFLTLMVVTVLVIVGISLVVQDPIRVALGPLIIALGIAALLGLGSGTMNACLFSFFPVWRRLWPLINRPLFIISGIFFTYESMPASIQDLIWWNPIIHVIGHARGAFYPIYNSDYVSLAYPFGIGLGLFIVGTAIMLRHKTYLIENE